MSFMTKLEVFKFVVERLASVDDREMTTLELIRFFKTVSQEVVELLEK